MTPELHLTGDRAADALLSSDPLALVIGMLLDQQVSMEVAFAGPAKIAARMGDASSIDAAAVASYDPEEFVQLFRVTPAVHRFPGSMAARVQMLCRMVVDDWDGDASAIWMSGDPTGADVLARLKKLPGFGEQKAKIFLALLGKQYGLDAPGWRDASAPLGEPGTFHSVADIVDADSLTRVRESKKAHKAAMKARRG
ncbi:MAG TPA: HhH-GPD-type base excision DNA repair protein [Microbacteriaceae bacterium]